MTTVEENRGNPWMFHKCYFCSYCSKSSFVMCKHFRLHKRSKTETFICHSKTPEMFECDFCEFKTDLKVDLTEHYRVLHGGKIVNEEMGNILECHICKNCDFETYSVFVFMKHLSNCNMFRKEHKAMQKANKPSPSEDHKWHVFRSFEGHKLYRCVHCEYESRNITSMKRHIMARHTDINDIQWFKCNQCTYKAKRKGHLKKHIIEKHTTHDVEEKQWIKCSLCAIPVLQYINLKQHIKENHTLSENHSTTENDKWSEFRPLDDVKYYKCNHCMYATQYKTHIRRHVMARHTDAEDIHWSKCEQCTYKTKQKHHLNMHIKMKHTNMEHT